MLIIFYVAIITTIVLSFGAMYHTERLSERYSNYRNGLHLTGQELVKKILKDNNLKELEITHDGGDDYFNAEDWTINLSDTTYGRDTVTSLAISAHECGHVLQAKHAKLLISIKKHFTNAVNIAIYIATIMLALAYVMKINHLFYMATFLLVIASGFQLLTLPLEIDASRRALKYLKTQNIEKEELKAIKKLLAIAAVSYLGNLFYNIVKLFKTTWELKRKSLSGVNAF